MRKLTNTQIKELSNVNSHQRKITLASGSEFTYIEYEWISQATQMDIITHIAEQILFIDGEYCPQYLIVAKSVAWLSVCTDIPLVRKKVQNKETSVEIIDFETNYRIAQTLLHQSDKESTGFMMIDSIINDYVGDRLVVSHNRVNIKLEKLTSECENSVSIITNISQELEKVYKETDIMSGLQDVAKEMNGLNKRLDGDASNKIISMLSSKESV